VITVITGLPGSGKTLYALTWVKAKSEREGRQVFYSGITDLKLPWVEFEPEKWESLPTGSIIVVDECQRVFRPRMHGAAVPPFIAALETHRHKGVDFVLITQHPLLLDSNVRRLAGQHFHVVRKFGTQAATVHEWGSVKDNADKNRTGSTRHDFVYPASSFAFYKSAELHTHKRNIPMRVVWLGVMPLVLLACAFLVYRFFSDKASTAPLQLPSSVSVSPGGSPASSGGAVSGMSLSDWASLHEPRVVGLAYTAPVYDDVTKPVRAPVPSACVQSARECRCYSQQGTRLDVPLPLCRSLVVGGFFEAFDVAAPPKADADPAGGRGRKPPSGEPSSNELASGSDGHVSLGQSRGSDASPVEAAVSARVDGSSPVRDVNQLMLWSDRAGGLR
jgi:hypothetical protein